MAANSILGSLLGAAVGDAVGLPYEGLSPGRAAKLLGRPDRHRFCFGRGMVSDDTEHACLTAEAWLEAGGDQERFRLSLARRLRWWLLGVPAGVGLATLRASLKLWLGFPPLRSGVNSAGNGPAMRAAILGTVIDDPQQLRHWVTASSRLTHTDPKADFGAFAVALAAHHARRSASVDPRAYLRQLREFLGAEAEELHCLLESAATAAEQGLNPQDFTRAQGWRRGVSGYIYQTVPAAIQTWFRHPHDLRTAVTDVILCGGDTDTTAAIVGGVIGAGVGSEGIPVDWLQGLAEWPRSAAWMKVLAEEMDAGHAAAGSSRLRSPSLWQIWPRNALFAALVLGHGFRRLAPPYGASP